MARSETLNILPAAFYEARLSEAAKRIPEDGIRAMFPLENRPGLISLLAGKPNAETFPITSLQFTMRDPAAGEDVKMELSFASGCSVFRHSSTTGIRAKAGRSASGPGRRISSSRLQVPC